MSGNKVCNVSVRHLVAFVAHGGDLAGAAIAGPTAEQGVAGHTWLAKKKSRQWQSEITVKKVFCTDFGQLQVSGRADFLLMESATSLLVEEVKTCLGDPARNFGSSEHWAQAKMYGFLIADAAGLGEHESVDVRLTRLDLIARETHSETVSYSVLALQKLCSQWVNQYRCWLNLVADSRQELLDTARDLPFPFRNYRPAQQSTARHVFRCIRDKRHLLLQAPTGSGKTMSMCYPMVKALGTQDAQRVLYLTTKGSSQTVLLDNLNQLRTSGLHLSLLQITAKSKACPCVVDEQFEQSDQQLCSRCIGYYDRLPAAREQALAAAWLDAQGLQKIADEYHLCPFEFALEMVPWVQWVVCDVNYWFDPVIRLSILEQGVKPALLIDEVHNLPDRVRGMFSAAINQFAIREVHSQIVEPLGSALAERCSKKASRVLKQLVAARSSAESPIPFENLQPLQQALEKLLITIDELRANPNSGLKLGDTQQMFGVDVGALLQPLRRFVALASWLGDHHLCLVNSTKKDNPQCQLVCLNPGPFIAARRSEVQVQLGFSATLDPPDYYYDNLGLNNVGEAELDWLAVPSYFPQQNHAVIITGCVNTRWQSRQQSLPELKSVINSVTRAKAGNYLLFMPSYDYIDLLLAAVDKALQQHWLVQPRNAREVEKQEFIESLINARHPTLAVAVLGGVFAESIDLPPGVLSGVMIVGTGMPQPNTTTKGLQNYWQQHHKDGFNYSFRWPGFAKVIQAAGRVVRSEQDRGLVMLIDDRYTRLEYRQLMPAHWQPELANSVHQIEQKLRSFWSPES